MLGSPQDVAQEYATRLLEGKYQRATVGQAVIDMAREQTGRKGLPSYEAKRNLAHAVAKDPATIRTSHSPVEGIEDKLLAEKILKSLKGRDLEMVALYMEGYNNREIGEKFDLTESRIHQILEKIFQKLRHKFNRDGMAM